MVTSGGTYEVVGGDVLVVVVVHDVVLVLVDDPHGREHVQGIVDAALHVLEVDLLAVLRGLAREPLHRRIPCRAGEFRLQFGCR